MADEKPPKKDEKRKRRKPKRRRDKDLEKEKQKPEKQNTPHIQTPEMSISQLAQTIQGPPPRIQMSNPMSPRKQTLMRHKKSDDLLEPSFVSEVKEIKRNRKSMPPHTPPSEDDDGKYSLILSKQNMEGKASLFRHPLARIVVFHEQLQDPDQKLSAGTLLGHGEFEVFQLHNGDVTYLACGHQFVYPLLRKLKMLRTAHNQFILPLLNPERYWKIHIDTEDSSVLLELETVLKGLVKYTNLSKDKTQDHAGHDKRRAPHFTPLFNDIPESPPSAPVSPAQVNLYGDFELLPKKDWAPPRQIPDKLITSALAGFSIDSPYANGKKLLHHPKPLVNPALANPFQKGKVRSSRSDSSDMDSLLDEYEENISTTKLINFSRPQSRAPSLASSVQLPVQYQRGKMAIFPDRMSNLGSTHEEEYEEFPSTSLSQYNRARNSQSGRSRTPSDLYTSVSTWMEPSARAPTLANSRSSYSLGKAPPQGQHLKDTYREIYRSFTEHNLAQVVEKERKPKTYSKLLTVDQVNRRLGYAESVLSGRRRPNDSMNSTDVYNLVTRPQPREKPKGAITRLFGW